MSDRRDGGAQDTRAQIVAALLGKQTWSGDELCTVTTVAEVAARLAPTMAAAERLCRIYFEIAAAAIGEDEVRRQRDQRLETSGKTLRGASASGERP